MSVDEGSERRREIGRRVGRWRARRGLTRRRFAELCGRSLSWVDKVESGERGLLRLPMLERVADVLHVSVEDLTDTTEVRQSKHCLDLFEVSAVRAALQSYQAISRVFTSSTAEIAKPLDLDRLTQQVTYAWTAFQNAHWPLLGQALPRLLTTAQAAVAACQVTPEGLARLPKERRAHYYLDVAQGHSLAGHHDDAVNTLLMAESLFPDEIRCRPVAIDLVEGLRRGCGGTPSTALHQLAARIGLADG